MVGRDALSNTFGECVVAKANEADCGAQTPMWTCRRVRKEGVIAFKELRRTLCRRNTVPPTGTQKQPYERDAPYFFIYAHHPVCKHSVCLCRRYTVPPTGTQKQPYERDALYFFIYPPPYSQARRGGYMKKQPHGFRKVAFSLVPAVGLEPTRMISPQDFESSASASFTTPAQELIYHKSIVDATDFCNFHLREDIFSLTNSIWLILYGYFLFSLRLIKYSIRAIYCA